MSGRPEPPENGASASVPDLGWTAGIVRLFLESRLSALLLILSTLAGTYALLATPREEDPQIVVPFIDVFVEMPGASASEVERLLAVPFETILAEIPGVEHVYSTSSEGGLLVSARFFVSEDRERSIFKVTSAIEENRHRVPPGVTGWQIRPLDFDRVPIVTIHVFSRTLDEGALREVAQELLAMLRSVPDVGDTILIGGRPREAVVELDPARLDGHGVTVLQVAESIRAANVRVDAGSLVAMDRETPLRVGPFLDRVDELGDLLVGAVPDGRGGVRSIHLRDVAVVSERLAEPESYTRMGFGPASSRTGRPPEGYAPDEEVPSVTIGLAKRRGTNAPTVAEAIERRLEEVRERVVPAGVEATIVRNFGETANDKVHELVVHLTFAVVSVLALVGFVLGWREALVVALAVPVTLALTIAVGGVFGYSINRVSLFALILSLGLLVDDPIVDVENIHRHYQRRRHPPLLATLIAVDEIRPPTVLATLAVMLSFLPLYSMSGLLGPYMEPMAFNVPVAMAVSLLIAFTITPWAAYRFLKSSESAGHDDGAGQAGTSTRRFFERFLRPLLRDRRKGTLFLSAVAVAFFLSTSLIPLGIVPVKLLPYDNKDELLLVVDAPEGTPLERTDALLRSIGAYLRTVPEVVSYQTYAGTGSPIDLNGLVRRYFLRTGGHVGEVRIKLLHKLDRADGAHAISVRIRADLESIGRRHGAIVKVVEIPPGPPVLAGLVAEIHGPPGATYPELAAAARRVASRMGEITFLTEIDTSLEQERERLEVVVDRPKAAMHGIALEAVAETVRLTLSNPILGGLRREYGREPTLIRFHLPDRFRADESVLRTLRVGSIPGASVPLGELVRFERGPVEQPVQRKDRQRVVYVTAESLGTPPAEAVLRIHDDLSRDLPEGFWLEWRGDGEWKVTMDSLSDLGRAFAFSLAAIYVLLVAQTGSLALPGIIMLAIPLTMIGVFPGFWLLNLLFAGEIAGIVDPVFFSGPALMGLIALAGIVVRNSIILIDFIDVLRARGLDLHDAILEATVTRLRPILLTAGAALLGAWIIVLDPIFSGLAWAIVFGLVSSTALTLAVVPISYARLAPGARKP